MVEIGGVDGVVSVYFQHPPTAGFGCDTAEHGGQAPPQITVIAGAPTYLWRAGDEDGGVCRATSDETSVNTHGWRTQKVEEGCEIESEDRDAGAGNASESSAGRCCAVRKLTRNAPDPETRQRPIAYDAGLPS